MRERPIEDKPSLLEVALVLVFILLVMAVAGRSDYQTDLERENAHLKRENLALRADLAAAPSPASGGGLGRGENSADMGARP